MCTFSPHLHALSPDIRASSHVPKTGLLGWMRTQIVRRCEPLFCLSANCDWLATSPGCKSAVASSHDDRQNRNKKFWKKIETPAKWSVYNGRIPCSNMSFCAFICRKWHDAKIPQMVQSVFGLWGFDSVIQRIWTICSLQWNDCFWNVVKSPTNQRKRHTTMP